MWKFGKTIFKKENISETATDIINPLRGWYRIYTFRADVTFEPDMLYGCIMPEETLALLIINIGAYAGRELDENCICNMKNILTWFQNKGKEIILRVVYDSKGKGMEHEPSLYSLVKTHMKQISELLSAFRCVYIFQGLLIGSWGEMHNSRYLKKEILAELTDILTIYNPHIYTAVRSPKYWRNIYSSDYTESGKVMVTGIFNDAIMGSATDLGTYAPDINSDNDYAMAWSREKELQFTEYISHKAPYGGEAVYPQDDGYKDVKSQIEYLRKINATYLNCIHDCKILDMWRNTLCGEAGVWKKKSVYDYVGSHLGYRFVVRDVKVKAGRNQTELRVTIENSGFARLYAKAQMYIQIISNDEKNEYIAENFELDEINSGSRSTAVFAISEKKGNIYIGIRRVSDNREIYFANESVDCKMIKLGELTIS